MSTAEFAWSCCLRCHRAIKQVRMHRLFGQDVGFRLKLLLFVIYFHGSHLTDNGPECNLLIKDSESVIYCQSLPITLAVNMGCNESKDVQLVSKQQVATQKPAGNSVSPQQQASVMKTVSVFD